MDPDIKTTNAAPIPKRKKFLARLRDELRLRRYSLSTEHSYAGWTRRFILFHQKRHPQDMAGPEVRAFPEYLALVGGDFRHGEGA